MSGKSNDKAVTFRRVNGRVIPMRMSEIDGARDSVRRQNFNPKQKHQLSKMSRSVSERGYEFGDKHQKRADQAFGVGIGALGVSFASTLKKNSKVALGVGASTALLSLAGMGYSAHQRRKARRYHQVARKAAVMQVASGLEYGLDNSR